MEKVQIKGYVSPETKDKLKELLNRYNEALELGKVSQSELLEKAINEMYEREVKGDE